MYVCNGATFYEKPGTADNEIANVYVYIGRDSSGTKSAGTFEMSAGSTGSVKWRSFDANSYVLGIESTGTLNFRTWTNSGGFGFLDNNTADSECPYIHNWGTIEFFNQPTGSNAIEELPIKNLGGTVTFDGGQVYLTCTKLQADQTFNLMSEDGPAGEHPVVQFEPGASVANPAKVLLTKVMEIDSGDLKFWSSTTFTPTYTITGELDLIGGTCSLGTAANYYVQVNVDTLKVTDATIKVHVNNAGSRDWFNVSGTFTLGTAGTDAPIMQVIEDDTINPLKTWKLIDYATLSRFSGVDFTLQVTGNRALTRFWDSINTCFDVKS
jgi:hypothetical protein